MPRIRATRGQGSAHVRRRTSLAGRCQGSGPPDPLRSRPGHVSATDPARSPPGDDQAASSARMTRPGRMSRATTHGWTLPTADVAPRPRPTVPNVHLAGIWRSTRPGRGDRGPDPSRSGPAGGRGRRPRGFGTWRADPRPEAGHGHKRAPPEAPTAANMRLGRHPPQLFGGFPASSPRSNLRSVPCSSRSILSAWASQMNTAPTAA